MKEFLCRLRHKQTQKVKIILGGISEDFLRQHLVTKLQNLTFQNFTIENYSETLSLIFEREAEDNSLGETISFLTENGAKILDIETKKPTLLDVLESYE